VYVLALKHGRGRRNASKMLIALLSSALGTGARSLKSGVSFYQLLANFLPESQLETI
jgi:hypothetical protein